MLGKLVPPGCEGFPVAAVSRVRIETQARLAPGVVLGQLLPVERLIHECGRFTHASRISRHVEVQAVP